MSRYLTPTEQVSEVRRVIEALKNADGSIHGDVVDVVRHTTGEWLEAALDGRLDPEDAKRTRLPQPNDLSREIEPPVGTWVKDRLGGFSYHQEGGWGEPGMYPTGRWTAMWDARGPYVRTGPWGTDL